MNDQVEARGKTVKEAVAEALLRMGARREEVTVKVIEEPKSGFLGLLGGRQAKVLVEKKKGGGGRSRGGRRRGGGRGHSLSDNERRDDRRKRNDDNRRKAADSRPAPATAEKKDGDEGEAPRRRRRRGSRGRGRGRGRGRDAATTETAGAVEAGNRKPHNNEAPAARNEDRPASTQGRGNRDSRDSRDNRDNRDNRRGRSGGDPQERRRERSRRDQRGRNRSGRDQEAAAVVAPTEAPAQASEVRAEVQPAPARRESSPAREERPPRAERSNPRENETMDRKPRRPAAAVEPDGIIREGLTLVEYAKPTRDVPEAERSGVLESMAGGMLLRAGFPNRCQVVDGEYLQVRVVTDDSGAALLIGRQGATVDSIEHIVERMISTASGDRVKMNLDINNYRRRRQDTLADRVYDAIAKVRETGESVHMDPMHARDRRLVHLQVEEAGGLTTETILEAGSKHVVISLQDGEAESAAAPADGAVDAEASAEEQPEG